MLKIAHREMLGERIGQDLIHVDCYSSLINSYYNHSDSLIAISLLSKATIELGDHESCACFNDVDCGRQV